MTYGILEKIISDLTSTRLVKLELINDYYWESQSQVSV